MMMRSNRVAEANNEVNKVCTKSSKFAKLLLSFVHFEHFPYSLISSRPFYSVVTADTPPPS